MAPNGLKIGSAVVLLLALMGFIGRGGHPVAAVPGRVSPPRVHYRIDPYRSRLAVETHTTGLSTMFGHDHEIGARRFDGVVSFIPGAPETASLDLTVRADSLALLDRDLGEPVRRDIERTIRKSLDTAKYPQISFHASGATADLVGPGVYQVKLAGELYLHGTRNELTIAAQVAIRPDTLRLNGSCRVRQSDYGIGPISFANGTVGIEDEVTISFDVVAPAVLQRGASAASL
jgi:polyisoprenoid-binding protein YceI